MPPNEAPTLEKGHTIDGKYDIVRQLGAGGMGAVYEAVHRGTNRRVALKVILSSALAKEEGVIARFQREARASGSIDSAHVVQVLDTGIEPTTGNPYMVMEYLSGEDVHDLVRRLGPLHPSLAVRIVAQACLGLERAHEAGIVHRDIKSANLYLARRDGGEMAVKVLDFGIAKVRADGLAANDDQNLTRTGSLIGSPLFMSPEQARGVKNLDGRADLWSLGVVLYEALTGSTPNADKETLGDLLISICMEDPPPLQERAPWVSPELTAIVQRALARDLSQRFASAREMHDALAGLSPGGIALREDMLTPLPEGMQSHVAVSQKTILTPAEPYSKPLRTSPTLASTAAVPPSGLGSSPPSAPPPSLPGAVTGSEGATDGLGSSSVGRASKRSLGVLLVSAGVLVAVGGAFAGLGVARRPATGTAMVASAGNGAPSTSTSALPDPAGLASAVPAPRVVRVAVVAPPETVAVLDGSPATLRDGAVEISGAPGSLHKLRLSLGDDVRETDVTILESGAALPPSVELVVKAPAKPTKPVAAAVSAAVPVKPKPAATPPAAPPPPASEPSVKRTF